MSIVVTLVGYAPPARADGTSFTSVLVYEAASSEGPWTLIDTLNHPVDADPEHPVPHDLTTVKATLPEGFYRVVWRDGAGGESAPSAPVQDLSELSGGTRPTVTDVAALLRARTKVKGGTEQGTFSTQTRPTSDEVDAIIDDAVDEVLGKVALPVQGTAYERRVRGAVRLYAAVLIEMSYFPEQVGSGKSPAATYEKLYESRIRALIAEGETGEPQGEGSTDAPADPAWIFPATALGRW